jgi:hypothetical protein
MPGKEAAEKPVKDMTHSTIKSGWVRKLRGQPAEHAYEGGKNRKGYVAPVRVAG